MTTDFYILQYHLYVLALDRWLKLRLPGYRYEDHFGGVFYIFLRGVSAEKGPEFGIYKDLPNPGLIEVMGRNLIP
jgi:exodeoxyribonuclease V beta subunit